jgi:hypothetical protein
LVRVAAVWAFGAQCLRVIISKKKFESAEKDIDILFCLFFLYIRDLTQEKLKIMNTTSFKQPSSGQVEAWIDYLKSIAHVSTAHQYDRENMST